MTGSTLLARRFGTRISTPVVNVAKVAHRLREGDLSARAVEAGPPESVEMASALNALADRIDTLLDGERERIADLGHRLRTPVTALRLDADLVADPEVAERLREHVANLQRGIDEVVKDARRRVRDPLPVGADLAAVVWNRVAFWEPLSRTRGGR